MRRIPQRRSTNLKRPAFRARIGADMPGNTNLIFALIPKVAFGLNLTIAGGYVGGKRTWSAAQRRNEIDGQVIGLVFDQRQPVRHVDERIGAAAYSVRPH